MQAADYLTILNILVALVGTLLVVFTLVEWNSLRRIKKNFTELEQRIRVENHTAMKAAHRVISSYQIKNIDDRIPLLESAVNEYPGAFNGYNALGYAYLEKGEPSKAIDAFRRAVELHPQDKAGYFDLANAYIAEGQEDLAIKYLQCAIAVDPSAKTDIANDQRLKKLSSKVLG